MVEEGVQLLLVLLLPRTGRPRSRHHTFTDDQTYPCTDDQTYPAPAVHWDAPDDRALYAKAV